MLFGVGFAILNRGLMNGKKFTSRGFSLAELMIVIVIIAVLALFGILAFHRQSIRGNDVKRKSDLEKMKILFEDYYNDNDCYPQMATWNAYNCIDGSGGQFFAPYLSGQNIPCDPVTNERYLYITIPEDQPANVSACSGYKLFAALGNRSDPDIVGSGCDPDPNKGCGYEPYKFNYGIAVGGTVRNASFDFAAPTPTPTPEFPIGNNFCLGDPNPEHACNTKEGLVAPAYGNAPCGDVLRDTFSCVSFSDGALCSSLCASNFSKYKCQATTSVQCVQ